MTNLNAILTRIETAKKICKAAEEKRQNEFQEMHNEIKRKSLEQIETLTLLQTAEFEAEYLYGFNSEQCKVITQQIKEYFKDLTHETAMSLIAIGVKAILAAKEIILNDPVKSAIFVQRQAIEKLNHDTERISNIDQDFSNENISEYCPLGYSVAISRAFPQDGQTMNVRATFRCEIYILQGTVKIEYRSVNTFESINQSEFTQSPSTVADFPINRDYIFKYLNDNLIAVFGEGATQKSLNNFFNWYDEVVPRALSERAIVDERKERTLRFIEAHEAENRLRRQLGNEAKVKAKIGQ